MPWPWATDGWGIAYPAGLKMIVGAPDADAWDGDWEAYAIANAGSLSITAVCVPDSLPSGYTLNNKCGANTRAGDGVMRVKNLGRWYRVGQRYDHNFGYPTYDLESDGCNAFGTELNDRFQFPRVWHGAAGDQSLSKHRWGPMLSNGYGAAPFGNYVGGGGLTGSIAISFPAFYGAGPEVSFYSAVVQVYQGCRYSLARYTSTGTIAGVHVKITRNSGWTNPGGPGATTVQDVTLGATTNVAAWSDLTIGEILPPLGTFGYVHIQVWATGDAVLSGNMGLTVLSGPRCDIPICCTTTYRDWEGTEHIIPGGYVAGILTNPPFTPGILSSSFNYFASEYNGDGKFVYLKYTGSPSTTYTFASNGFSVGGIQFFQGDEATGEPQSGSGPPGLGPWTFTTGTDGVAWAIVDVHGENGTSAQFKVT